MRSIFRPARGVVLLVVGLAMGACSEPSQPEEASFSKEHQPLGGAGSDAAAGMPMPPPPPPSPGLAGVTQGELLSSDAARRPAQLAIAAQAPTADDQQPGGAMLIRMGDSRLEVDSLEAAIAAVQRTAAALDGWIAHSSLTLGERQQRSARLEVKLPAERWDELLAGLERIGELRQLTTSTEDVGEQYVDLTAQLGNAERLEERFLQLLESRTGSLEDLLAVERELARVRERIEMLQGRLRYLSQRVAISTMMVHLVEPIDLLAVSPDSEPIRDAFREAWRNFLGVITGGIALLGAVLPVALLLGAAVWIWRRTRRRRRESIGPA
jgi:hypothetical protein